jgi:hypothetical protein
VKSAWHEALARPVIAPYAPQEIGPARLQFISQGQSRRRAFAENCNRKTLAPPRFQRFTSDCGALLFWTGRKRLERIGVMEKRNDDAS